MLWKLNMDIMNGSDFSSAHGSIENDRNMENILDTSIMIDPRKSTHYKYRPEDYDIMEWKYKTMKTQCEENVENENKILSLT